MEENDTRSAPPQCDVGSGQNTILVLTDAFFSPARTSQWTRTKLWPAEHLAKTTITFSRWSVISFQVPAGVVLLAWLLVQLQSRHIVQSALLYRMCSEEALHWRMHDSLCRCMTHGAIEEPGQAVATI